MHEVPGVTETQTRALERVHPDWEVTAGLTSVTAAPLREGDTRAPVTAGSMTLLAVHLDEIAYQERRAEVARADRHG
jgi:hypothetical protein